MFARGEMSAVYFRICCRFENRLSIWTLIQMTKGKLPIMDNSNKKKNTPMRRNKPHIKGAPQCAPHKRSNRTYTHTLVGKINISTHTFHGIDRNEKQFSSIDCEMMIIMCAPHNHRFQDCDHTMCTGGQMTATTRTAKENNNNLCKHEHYDDLLYLQFRFNACFFCNFQCLKSRTAERQFETFIACSDKRDIVQTIHDCLQSNEMKRNEMKRRK